MCPHDSPSVAALPRDVFQRIFTRSPNAALLCTAEGDILVANPAFEALFDLDGALLVGTRLGDLLRPVGTCDADGRMRPVAPDVFQGEALWAFATGDPVDVAVFPFPVGETSGTTLTCHIFRDIAPRREAEERLHAVERRHHSFFENAVEGIFRTTPQGRYLEANRTLACIYGFASVAEMITYFRDIKNQLYVDPGRRDDFVRELAARDGVQDFESAIRKKDGSVIWISENARVVRDTTGAAIYYEGTVVDISDRKRAEQELEIQRAYFSQLFANSPQGIVMINPQRTVVDANQGFEELFGYRTDEIKGVCIHQFIVPDDLRTECENLRAAMLAGRSVQRETTRRTRDGRDIPVSVIGFPVNIQGDMAGLVYIYQDISERKAFEAQITHQAFHDALTGLPNRSLLADRLERALARAKRRGDIQSAVLMIDLNKFKDVNDSLGHQAGDQLLVEVAERLRSCLRTMDTVARLGGDEFAVILEEFKSKREVLHAVERIGTILGLPFSLTGTTVTPEASIGVVLRTRDYNTAEDILRDADIAMYRAKEQGRPYMVFDQKMHQEILEAITLESELRHAVAHKELLLYYQPIVSVQTGALEGFEALVRWAHPLRGIIAPARFIPLAEETGLILPIGRFVISEACRQLRQWQLELPQARDLSISVNVSCRQFAKDGLVEHVTHVLHETGLDPACLKLEITESVLMHDTKRTGEELARLKALGVKIAIDDFGTGYSSLAYLRQLPIDHLKIDRSFISGEEHAGESQKIVTSIIALARNLGLTVIAEGVECPDQLERLRLADCDKAQGYMFSRPVERNAAAELIRTGC